MSSPSQLDAVFGWGIFFIGLFIVAAVGRQVVKAALGNPIPMHRDEKRRELEEKYGYWAVNTAIAVCPHDDIRCIEREAKRLSEARLLRRR